MKESAIGWIYSRLAARSACLRLLAVLAETRSGAHTRILPLDFDRSPASDTGYTGWVQLPDGEIYVVNYILDDAPKAQIRGYALSLEDFLLEGQAPSGSRN